MPELSILIPMIGCQSAIDDTLISVLENRPADSEVICLCPPKYRDPYQLADEVRMVTTDGSSWMELANAGLQSMKGHIVHLLHPGSLVTPEWSHRALSVFDHADGSVLAVTPKVSHSGDRRFVSAGVSSSETPQLVPRASVTLENLLYPCFRAGFFRAAPLRQIGGWNTTIHPLLADWELGQRATCQEMESRFAPDCRIEWYGVTVSPREFRATRDIVRINRRYRGTGWSRKTTGRAIAAFCRLQVAGGMGYVRGLIESTRVEIPPALVGSSPKPMADPMADGRQAA